tara:strand:- start:5006 stop:5671 length:666 start_codon:yes stop_codon:yes gene_type:complete
MESKSKTCGKYRQYSVKKEFQVKYGSIVETILVDNQRIFYKNENNETRERWFIKRQLTKESKQQYDRKELEKINNDKGESLDDGDFLEITRKKYIKIYQQTNKMKKETKKIGIPEKIWNKMKKFKRLEYISLLKQNGITHLLVLSPYVFAATDSATRYNRRTEMKKEAADAKRILETSELLNLVQLKNAFPDVPENEIQRVLDLFNNQIKMAATFLESKNK